MVVMVSDNNIDSQGSGIFHFFIGCDPAIYRDNQRYSPFLGAFYRFFFDAITLVQAVGYIGPDFPSLCVLAEGMDQNGCCGYSIHIIIAMDHEGLFAENGFLDSANCFFHLGEKKWRMKIL